MLDAGTSYDGDLGATLVGVALEAVVARLRDDGTWKAGVFSTKALRRRRCVLKSSGLSQREAEQEVAGLRWCVRRETVVWD